MMRHAFSYLAVLLALTGAYVLAGRLGLSLAFLNPSASPVWPPTGLAIAAMLLLGYRIWPAVLIGSFLVNLTTAGTLFTSSAIAAGNTAEAVLGAFLAIRFAGGREAFDAVQQIVRFVFFAAIPATVLSASVGVASLVLGGQATWESSPPIWLTWWTGNFVSSITIAPLVLIWLGKPLPTLSVARSIEAALLVAGIFAAGAVSFAGLLRGPAGNYPLGYLTLLPLLWASLRYHQHGAIAAAALTCGIAIWGTLRGYGPFVVAEPNMALLLLQTFMGTVTLMTLILAAAGSERRRVQSAMLEHEQHMRMALDSGRMGTWQWEIAGGKVSWSPRLEEIHGLAPGTFGGTFDAFLEDVHPDDLDYVKQSIQRSLELQTDHHIEYRLRLKDGRVRWVEGRGRLALDGSGRPVRLVGVCMDVTARKMAEAEREHLLLREQEARAEAEGANAAKDRFLAVLSHELRTPLTPVMLTASLLERSPELPEQFRGDIETIRRNVELEARLIDDLLDVTRVTRGKLELDLQPVNLHQLLHRTIKICCPEGRPHVGKDLLAENHVVQGDPARLAQVFWNLLSNAVKFTPEGGAIQIRSRDTVDGRVVVDITDSGPGIEPALLPRLFTAFEQGDAARSSKSGGLGLGLAITRALVTAHGGSIEAVSDGPGRGATFSVNLPTAVAVPELLAKTMEPGEALPLRPLRILLVEDHQSTLIVMRKLLSGRGHNVTTAASNADALRAAEAERFDLVLSDLGLPDGLAYGMMRTLRDRYGAIGIALSGYGTEADVQRSREAGFVEHLTKPVDVDTLHSTIARVAGNGDGRHQLSVHDEGRRVEPAAL